MLLFFKFVVIFVLGLLNLRAQHLGGNKIWKKEESTQYARKVYMGEYNAGEYIYYNVTKDNKFALKGTIVDLCKILYAKRRVFALEGILVSMFGQKKESIVTENVDNEPELMFFERRFTELLEHLYFLLKKPSQCTYEGKEIIVKKNLLNIKLWDYSQKQLITLTEHVSDPDIKNKLYNGHFSSANLNLQPRLSSGVDNKEYEKFKYFLWYKQNNLFIESATMQVYFPGGRGPKGRSFDRNLSPVVINLTPFRYGGLEFARNKKLTSYEMDSMNLEKINDLEYTSLSNPSMAEYLPPELYGKEYRTGLEQKVENKNCYFDDFKIYFQNCNNLYSCKSGYKYENDFIIEQMTIKNPFFDRKRLLFRDFLTKEREEYKQYKAKFTDKDLEDLAKRYPPPTFIIIKPQKN